MKRAIEYRFIVYVFLLLSFACNNEKNAPLIKSMDLKRGEVISCGPTDGEVFGSVSFTASVPEKSQTDFNIATALLYSFEYDEAEKMYAKVIDNAPDCAMAYWGVAMCNFHALWAPPTPDEITKGRKAIEIARSIDKKTKRESDYIEAIGKFYDDAGKLEHRIRVSNFEKAMQKIYETYTDDKEAVVFYALALDAAADPTDKSYAKQRKAFSLLNPLFMREPLHPGLAHFIIHNCDYPEMAELALPAARKYASIAPSSAHAQHMPSHIFTRLGLWDEAIKSNLMSVSSAQCYGEKAKLNGHWDEELHGLDYLVYAYLQRGEDDLAKQQLDYLQTINKVDPVTFKTAYAFAAIPSRYVLERKMWKDAADLEVHPKNYPWEKFPWQKAIIHFTRVLGCVNTGNIVKAKSELDSLNFLHDVLQKQKDKANEAAQVAVQIKTGEAWIAFKNYDKEKGLMLMKNAVDMEEGMEKHPVTPGEVIPARELLAEMLLQMNRPSEAFESFVLNLKTHPNRFNSLYGAARAAQLSGENQKAKDYYLQLSKTANLKNCKREQLQNLIASSR